MIIYYTESLHIYTESHFDSVYKCNANAARKLEKKLQSLP